MERKSIFVLLLISLFSIFFIVSCSKGENAGKKQNVKKPVQKKVEQEVNYNEMVFVPAGECIIGGPADDPVTKYSSPPHKVYLKSFWIDKYEVTFEQYLKFVADTGYLSEGNWRNYYAEGKELHPVFNVTLKDAKAYAKWAKKRLPTNEEWEKAASWDPDKKEKRRYPWGNTWKDNASNTAEAGMSTLVDIGKFKGDVSFYGVHDMLGNVFEWTDSIYKRYKGCKFRDKNYYKKLIVVKGANCYIQGKVFNLAARSCFAKNYLGGIGFRCVRDATPEEDAAHGVKPEENKK